jgi:hypothetical protein
VPKVPKATMNECQQRSIELLKENLL